MSARLLTARAPIAAVTGAGAGSVAPSDPYFMESLARGLSVIRAFGQGRSHLTGAEAAAITGLSRAAARRCLHTLTVLGYARASRGGFELTPAVLALGHAYLGATTLQGIAQPILDRAAARLQEACGLAVLDGEDIVFVARAAARRILSVEVSVGSRLDAACTASGRVLLAQSGEAHRERFLSRVKLVRHTVHTIVERKTLRAELDHVAALGYAVVDQELELGLRSMAVPVRRQDGVIVAALNVGVQAGRVEVRALQREFLPVLREAAEDIRMGLAGT